MVSLNRKGTGLSLDYGKADGSGSTEKLLIEGVVEGSPEMMSSRLYANTVPRCFGLSSHISVCMGWFRFAGVFSHACTVKY